MQSLCWYFKYIKCSMSCLLISNTFFQVVEQGMFVKHCKVEVYLTELKLCEDSNMDLMVTKRFSKADTIGRHKSLWRNLFTQILTLQWIQRALSFTWLHFSILITLYFHCFSFIRLFWWRQSTLTKAFCSRDDQHSVKNLLSPMMLF